MKKVRFWPIPLMPIGTIENSKLFLMVNSNEDVEISIKRHIGAFGTLSLVDY